MAGMLGGSVAQRQTRYTSIDLQTSALGVCIPLLWGRNRIGTSVIWQNDFVAKPAKSGGKGGGKGGGGKGSSGSNYWTAIMFALCEGPVGNIGGGLRVWADQNTTTLAALNLSVGWGTPGQTPPAWIVDHHPDQALSYARTTYVWSEYYALGQTATIPNHTFEVDGALSGSCAFGGNTRPDANPADIISDYLLSEQYGLDPGATYIDPVSWALYKTYCQAQAFWMSPYIRTQEQATQTIQRWAQLSNSWIFWNGTQIKFVPLGGAPITQYGVVFTPNLAPIYALTPTDFVPASRGGPLVTVTRIDPADGYNRVEIDGRNRDTGYTNDPQTWEDPASVDAYGLLQSQTITADEVCDPAIASVMAALIGQRSVYLRNTYEFTLGYQFVLLEPGDIVTLTEPNIGLAGLPVRITKVSEDEHGLLKFTAEESPFSVGIAPLVSVQPALPNPTLQSSVDPGSVNQPLIIEPPLSVTGGSPQLWVGASGGPNWGGAQVWLSTDNVNYAAFGPISTPTVQGVLTLALPASGSPDLVHTLAVNTAESQGIVSSAATDASASAWQTVCVVDDEVIAYGAVAPTGAYTANITRLLRGGYTSVAAAHSVGAPFWTIAPDAVLQITLPQSYVGVEIYVKLCSFNIFGQAGQDLSVVDTYTYTPSGVAYKTGGASTATIPPSAPVV